MALIVEDRVTIGRKRYPGELVPIEYMEAYGHKTDRLVRDGYLYRLPTSTLPEAIEIPETDEDDVDEDRARKAYAILDSEPDHIHNVVNPMKDLEMLEKLLQMELLFQDRPSVKKKLNDRIDSVLSTQSE